MSLLLAGCGGEAAMNGGDPDAGPTNNANNGTTNNTPSDVLPDFSLVDTNPTSPFAGEQVSPRRFLETVSGWYFTHAS